MLRTRPSHDVTRFWGTGRRYTYTTKILQRIFLRGWSSSIYLRRWAKESLVAKNHRRSITWVCSLSALVAARIRHPQTDLPVCRKLDWKRNKATLPQSKKTKNGETPTKKAYQVSDFGVSIFQLRSLENSPYKRAVEILFGSFFVVTVPFLFASVCWGRHLCDCVSIGYVPLIVTLLTATFDAVRRESEDPLTPSRFGWLRLRCNGNSPRG